MMSVAHRRTARLVPPGPARLLLRETIRTDLVAELFGSGGRRVARISDGTGITLPSWLLTGARSSAGATSPRRHAVARC